MKIRILLLGFLLAHCCLRGQDQPPRPGEAGNAQQNGSFPRPPAFDESTINMAHFSPARQASTTGRGPESSNCRVQVRNLEEHFGKDIGTSPFHVISSKRYRESNAITINGASLTDAYRFVVDGDRFEALDRYPINMMPTSIPWNITLFDDGRFVVPDPNGYRLFGNGPRTKDPTLLVLRDGDRVAEPLRRVHTLEVTEEMIRRVVAVPRDAEYAKATSAASQVATFSGELGTSVSFTRGEERLTYQIILDAELKGIVTGILTGKGLKSNETAAEVYGENGTAFYVPLGESIVKLVYDPVRRELSKHWERKLPVRTRTGSTPTLMNTSDGKQWVVVIDSKCAVSHILNGLITCDTDTRPSQLVAVERSAPAGTTPRVITAPLPEWLATVENSPAASGDYVTVANYSGYLPNGMLIPPGGERAAEGLATWGVSPDAVPDFATGIVTLKYDRRGGNFDVVWEDSQRQVSCIPTISTGSNLVYGVGAERETGRYYLYGFRLRPQGTERGGELKVRVDIGKAPFRRARRDLRGNNIFARSDYKFVPGEVYDAGNQVLLLPDRSIVVTGGRSLVRIRE